MAAPVKAKKEAVELGGGEWGDGIAEKVPLVVKSKKGSSGTPTQPARNAVVVGRIFSLLGESRDLHFVLRGSLGRGRRSSNNRNGGPHFGTRELLIA